MKKPTNLCATKSLSPAIVAAMTGEDGGFYKLKLKGEKL